MRSLWKRPAHPPFVLVNVPLARQNPGLVGAPHSEILAALLAHMGLSATWSEKTGVVLSYRPSGAEVMEDSK
jgi:hypothetical protein